MDNCSSRQQKNGNNTNFFTCNRIFYLILAPCLFVIISTFAILFPLLILFGIIASITLIAIVVILCCCVITPCAYPYIWRTIFRLRCSRG